AAASRSSPTSVLVRLIEGTNQHVMKKPRRAAHVELGRDPVEPLADVEGAVAPATYEGAQRRRDGAHVVGWRDRTPKPSKQAGRGPRLRGQTKNRPAKREIVNQFARKKRARAVARRINHEQHVCLGGGRSGLDGRDATAEPHEGREAKRLRFALELVDAGAQKQDLQSARERLASVEIGQRPQQREWRAHARVEPSSVD